MRRWIPVALIGLTVLWFILTNTGSSVALSDIEARPILALVQDDQSIPVQKPGQPPADGEARAIGGQGISFGYRLTFALPDGGLVICSHRFRSVSCDSGWVPERAPAD